MTKRSFLIWRWSLAAFCIYLTFWPHAAAAKDIGAEPPKCTTCLTCATCSSGQVDNEGSNTTTTISRTEGNLSERVDVGRVRSSAGVTLDVAAVYNSYNADASRVQLDTVMGYGWTHPYNVFLFSQLGSMFRFDGQGRVTRYKLGAGGTYTAAAGYFETLVKTSPTTFTLKQKDGTTYYFASIAGTPFIVVGPVYRLTSIVDRNGNVTTLTYAGGNLVGVSDTYGRTMTFTYTAQKKVQTVMDPAGRVTTFTYDTTGRKLTTITDPLGKTVQYSYNTLYQLTSKIDKDGRTFTYSYTSLEPTSVNDGSGSARARLSNPVNWGTNATQLAMNQLRVYTPSTTTNTDGRGNIWRYQYDANGRVTSQIAPGGATTTYTYDPATLQTSSVTDPNGHATSYQYDPQGNRIKTTDAMGNITTYTYEPIFNNVQTMTDPRGRVTSYTYDVDGNRTVETDPLLQTRSWTYDTNGNVLTEKDKNGNTTSYTYDAFGNRVQVTDAMSNVTIMTYDAVGNVLSRTDANGHTTSYTYDGMNREIIRTDPLLKTTQTQYDSQGNRTQTTDRNGNTTAYQYDLRQRLTKMTDAAGKVEAYGYDANDNRTSMTDRNLHTTTYQYDARNRVIRTIDALGNTATTTYDAASNVIAETDANLHTTSSSYDFLDRPVTVTNPLGQVTQTAYDAGTFLGCSPQCGATPGSSLVTSHTDANGKMTYYKYDALDRLIREVRKVGSVADTITPTDAVTASTYDPVGNRLSETQPNGNTTSYAYDALNRRIQETNAAGDVAQTMYDGVGNVIATTEPNGNVTATTYDFVDRPIQVTDSIGSVTTSTYDSEGNRISRADGNGSTTTYAYDSLNRLTTITDPLGKTTTVQYDSVGNTIKTTDRNGNATSYAYDFINRRVSTTDALGNVTAYQYDAVGNQIKIIDAGTHATQYQYDNANRMTKETFANGKTRTFTYDAVGNLITRTDQIGQVTTYSYNDLYFMTGRAYPSAVNDAFSYDLSGRMLSAVRGTWPVTFTYDGGDRLVQSVQNGRTVSYSYNIPSRTRTVTYPGSRQILEHMDARSRITRIDDPSPTLLATYTYDLADRPLTRLYRNGTSATYTYNANDWTTNIDHLALSGVAPIFNYAYDNEGNKKYEEHFHDTPRTQAYQYDTTNRLVDHKVGILSGTTVSPVSTQTAYNLDAVGNWSSKTTDSVTQTRLHSVVNELTKIDATTLTYDANGNPVSDGPGGYSYVYDEENRLVRIVRNSDAAIVGQYEYDALGRRVKKTASPSGPFTTTVYLYDAARIIEEQDLASATKATYVYGTYVDEVLNMDRAGQSYYYHQNALWSVASVTDALGAVVEQYDYDAYGYPTVRNGVGAAVPLNTWGTPQSAIGNPDMFTGRQLDEEAGLYFYRARYYDSVKGRFLQQDPEGYVDGMNLYEYVQSRPTFALDPNGLARTLGFTTTAGPKAGKCGEATWNIEWELSEASARGGHIVQSVFLIRSVKDCDGNAIRVRPANPLSYFEAWPVAGGATKGNPAEDHWTDPNYGKCTKGTITTLAKARFYEGVTTLPAYFTTNNRETLAGILPSVASWRVPDTYRKMFRDPNSRGGGNTVDRTMVTTWDCCPNDERDTRILAAR